jgi:hypothetical protein
LATGFFAHPVANTRVQARTTADVRNIGIPPLHGGY